MVSAVVRFFGFGLFCCGVSVLPDSGRAADIAAPQPADGWAFTGALYGWGAGIEGEAGLLGQPTADVDISFSDIVENLEFAVMGHGEARNGPFVLGMDLTYSRVGATADMAPETGLNSIDVTSTSWMVTGYGGYTLFDDDSVRLDAIAGGRLWSVNTEFEADSDNPSLDGQSVGDGQTWVDPLVGAKVRLDLMPDVYVTAWGMAGGFGVGSDMMWDLMAGAGYEFTESFSVFGGYRAVSVDYSNDGFVYDLVQQGPVIAGVFRF